MFIWRSVDHVTISSTDVCIRQLAILSITSITVTSFDCLRYSNHSNHSDVINELERRQRCLEMVDMNQKDVRSKSCAMRHSSIQSCPIRRDNVNFSRVGDDLVKMSATIEWWTVARQVRPSCLTLCGDQRDQTKSTNAALIIFWSSAAW